MKGVHARAIVGSFVFFCLAPGLVAGVGPFVLVGWTMRPPLLGLPGGRIAGAAAAAAGLACLLDCFAQACCWSRSTCSCCSMRSRRSVAGSESRTRPIACTWVDGGHV